METDDIGIKLVQLEAHLVFLEENQDDQKKKLECVERQLSHITKQVELGKHMIAFAKMMGWLIGVAATFVEVYRALKGNK